MTDLVTNSYEIARARAQFLGDLGLDAKRPMAWVQYGYEQSISFDTLLAAYERGGAAHGAVHKLLDGCWQKLPRIKSPASDKESAWEKKAGKVLRGINARAKLRDFYWRNLVGRHSALIYRAGDGQTLSEPLDRATWLVDLIPVYESQIKVTTWHSDAEDYGTPSMFQYRCMALPGVDTQGRPEEWADVHPSRVQILAKGSVGDFFEGVPLLRAGFNRLACRAGT